MEKVKEQDHRITEIICRWIVALFFFGIAGTLWWFSLRWSEITLHLEEMTYTDGFIPAYQDGVKANLLWGVLIIAVLCMLILLDHVLYRKNKAIPMITFSGIVTGCFVCASIFWVVRLGVIGRTDAEFIRILAEAFLQGDYSSFWDWNGLGAGAYLGKYPQQITVVQYYILLIRIFGSTNASMAFQIGNAFFAGSILFFGERSVTLLWNSRGASIAYLLLTAGFLPLLFYTGFTYGEIPAMGLMAPALFLILKLLFEKKNNVITVPVIFLLCVTAVGMKTSVVIFLIAAAIVIIVACIRDRRLFPLILLPLMMISSFAANSFLRNVVYADVPKADPMPSIAWIDIGIHDGSGHGIGAYDGMIETVYRESGYDTGLIRERCTEDVRERIGLFLENPDAGRAFYMEKLRWQWIEPTCWAFVSYDSFKEGYPKGIAYDTLFGKYREMVFAYMDHFQSLLYFLALMGILGLLLRKERFEGLLWPIILIGGALFSLLWEAAPRYVFPYVVFTLPLCGYGISFLVSPIIKRNKV